MIAAGFASAITLFCAWMIGELETQSAVDLRLVGWIGVAQDHQEVAEAGYHGVDLLGAR